MIFVNRPYLPSFKRYKKYLKKIWDSNYLTNFGPLSRILEERLCEYLGVKNLLFVSNGTLALQIAYKLAGLKKGDGVITTPFSFIATTSSLLWDGLEPHFVDIDKNSFNLDSTLLESEINQNVKAILPVHVFGNPCLVESLEYIAKRRNLKLIYDASHAFGVEYKGQSVLNYGDISTLSFHATKLFSSVEGGAVIFRDSTLLKEAREIINFGLVDSIPKKIGINAKNTEFHAAFALCVLDDMPYILESREMLFNFYKTYLQEHFELQYWSENATNNYHYFPILFDNEIKLQEVQKRLNMEQIYPRRYFYPSLNKLSFVKDSGCPISESVASRILCLPFYVGLKKKEQEKIIKLVLNEPNKCFVTKPKIVLIGGGGHCGACIDVINKEGRFEIIGVVDNYLKSSGVKAVFDYAIYGEDELESLRQDAPYAFVSFGQIKSANARIEMYQKLKLLGFMLPCIVSPLAYVAKGVIIKEGSIIMHNALINNNVKIGKMCIINSKALVEHDCVVEDFCHLSTASVINGNCFVGRGSFLGSNMVLKHESRVVPNSVLYANLLESKIVAGGGGG